MVVHLHNSAHAQPPLPSGSSSSSSDCYQRLVRQQGE
jgi:hypothetical protein